MRRVVLGLFFAMVLLGFGYSYTRGTAGRAYITSPVERGTIVTSVKADRFGRAGDHRGGELAALGPNFGSARQFQRRGKSRATDRPR